MANIHDYLRWRGDLAFDERAFNDCDNLILSALIYLDFTGIVPGETEEGSITLRKACRKLLAKSGGNVTPYVRSLAKIDTLFVDLIGNSRRFGDAQLRAYSDIVNKDRALQFAAMQIDLPHEGSFIAFRGTDTTLVGWRENLMISYQITAAQEEAARYLERAIKRTADTHAPIRVGGHSKGGNLAEYAAACCPETLREHIVRVYSNDGPGMAPEVMPQSPRQILKDRLRLIVPTFSVVGMLFARPKEQRIIVASSASGIEQHDITTWKVLPTGVKEERELLPDCVGLNAVIASWAKEIPLNEREHVTLDVFDALQTGGALTFDQIASSPEGVQQVIRALGATDERTRDIAMELVQRAASSGVDAVRNAALRAFEDASRRLRESRARRAGTLHRKKGKSDLKVYIEPS